MTANRTEDQPTHYEVLGVKKDAQTPAIKTAYKRLMRTYHPDVYGPEGEAISRSIGAAYSVLSNDQARARYDAELSGSSLGEGPADPMGEDEDIVFEDAWGEEAQWDVPAGDPEDAPVDDGVDEGPAPGRERPRPAPAPPGPGPKPHRGRSRPRLWPPRRRGEPTGTTDGPKNQAGPQRETTWPLSEYPQTVYYYPLRRARRWSMLLNPLGVAAMMWGVLGGAPIGPLGEGITPMLLVLAAGALGMLIAYVFTRSSTRRRRRPADTRPGPRPVQEVPLAIGVVLAVAAVVALTPPGAGLFGGAGLGLVTGWALGLVLLSASAAQKHLDGYIKLSSLKANNTYGRMPGGVVASMVNDALSQLYDIPQLRVFRTDAPNVPFTHALVVGDRVALVRGITSPPGTLRWSGPSLLREVPGGYPEEVLTGDYVKSLEGFAAAVGPKVQVSSWLVVYTTPAGAPVHGIPAAGHPVISAAASAVQDIGDFLVSGDQREVVDQAVVIDTLIGLTRSAA